MRLPILRSPHKLRYINYLIYIGNCNMKRRSVVRRSEKNPTAGPVPGLQQVGGELPANAVSPVEGRRPGCLGERRSEAGAQGHAR